MKVGRDAIDAAKNRRSDGGGRIKLQAGDKYRVRILTEADDMVAIDEHWVLNPEGKRVPVVCPMDEHGECPLCSAGDRPRYQAHINLMVYDAATDTWVYKYMKAGTQFVENNIDKYYSIFQSLTDRWYYLTGTEATIGSNKYVRADLIPDEKDEMPDDFKERKVINWQNTIVVPTPASLAGYRPDPSS
jgi:hypothetical protein